MQTRQDRIVQFVAEHHGVPAEALKGGKRGTALVSHVRHLAMWLMRNFCSHMSLTDIGNEFGGMDHSSVSHAIRRIEREVDAQFVDPPDVWFKALFPAAAAKGEAPCPKMRRSPPIPLKSSDGEPQSRSS